MKQIIRIIKTLILLWVLSGCKSFGSETIIHDKEDFTNSITESMKNQMLSNIVRLRYGDMPLFLDIKSIIKSYSLEYRLNAGVDIYPNFEPNASMGGTYADKPTISYSPLVGNDFANSMMKPLTATLLVQLMQAGSNAKVIFRLFCDEINGFANRQSRGPIIRNAEADFDRIVQLLQNIQTQGILDLQVRSKDEDALLMIIQTEDTEGDKDLIELKKLLNLPPDQESFKMIYGMLPGEKGEIALLTRSFYSILIDLSADVMIPEEHVLEGRANPGYEDSKQIIAIQSGPQAPQDAFVSILYRDLWFWIDDTDIKSKHIFSNLLTIFTMSGTNFERVAPVLTIPAG